MAFRDSTVAQMNATTALTGTAPTGVASGDRLLAWVVQDNTGHTHTAATGWDATPLAQLTNSGPDGQLATLFEKKNASGSDSYNFTSSSSTRAIVIVSAWSGRDNTAAAVVNSSVNNSGNASPVSVAISGVTASANDDLAYFAQLDQTSAGGAWAWSALSGFTEREDSFNNDWISTTLWTNDAVSAGATGTLTATATLAAASAGFSGVVVALPVSGGGSPTTTNVTGSATAGVGIAETYTYTLDASPAGTVTVTPTAPVAGSWSPTTVGLTSGNWNTGLTSDFTASAAGSGNISSTNDGGLTNDTLAVTVASVSRPSAVTPNTWTDEAGGTLVVADINDASDSTGAKDPAGASYPVLAFTMDTPMAASVSQTCYFRGNNVAAGKQARQVLFATDGTTVVATGAWHTMTDSLATYSDSLTPTATAYKGEIQTQAVPGLMTYSTTFSGTENPISESGAWTNGGSVGLDWKNIQTNGSIAHASATSPSYDDCCAHLSGFDPVSHYAQATIYKAGGYAPTDNHEVELLVAATITANSIYLYEFLWSVAGAVQFVRWDGALGVIDTGAVTVRGLNTSIGSPADGDVIKLTFGISGGNPIMDLYVNGVLKQEMTDITAGKLTSGGQPGMSFFVRSGDTVLTSFGFTDFSASDI